MTETGIVTVFLYIPQLALREAVGASRATSIDPSWERIGVTGNHPIWSQDRHDYVAAKDLRLGERLKNLSGDTVWVQQKLPRPGPTPVYNLEVQDEHVYYVGTNGVLAHNAGKDYGDGAGRIGQLESRLASRTMNRAEWKELSQLRRIKANDLQQISRWGRPGLQPNDWVMKGSPNWVNYFFSFKWQPKMTNRFAPFRSGKTYFVPRDLVNWPDGWGIDGWWKGLFGQRIFRGRKK